MLLLLTIDVKEGRYKYDVLITQKIVTETIKKRILPNRPYAYYSSDTYVTLIWVNGILEIPLEQTLFTSTGTHALYQNAMRTWGMKKYFLKWDIDVKREINKLKLEYDDKVNPNNQINVNILTDLDNSIKKYMGQKSDW